MRHLFTLINGTVKWTDFVQGIMVYLWLIYRVAIGVEMVKSHWTNRDEYN